MKEKVVLHKAEGEFIHFPQSLLTLEMLQTLWAVAAGQVLASEEQISSSSSSSEPVP